MIRLTLSVALTIGSPALAQPAKSVKVTVLSTMLAGNPNGGIGEWGFAALVKVDGRRVLVDTGARSDAVLKNAAELKVDLSDVTDVVLTHNHLDHTGGLVALRQELSKKNPRALSRAHVGKAIFSPPPTRRSSRPPADCGRPVSDTCSERTAPASTRCIAYGACLRSPGRAPSLERSARPSPSAGASIHCCSRGEERSFQVVRETIP